MANFEIHHNANGIYEIDTIGSFRDSDTEYLIEMLANIHESRETNYLYIDLSQHHVLPLRALGSTILNFYREQVYQAPLFIALIVQPSLAQVLTSVIKTLMRRELVQVFTEPERAYQWLEIERQKQ